MINIGIGIPFGQRSAGIDPQAKIAFDSLQSAGFTTPQGITGINAAFKTIKTIYGTSDITTAISFFGDPSLAYQIGAGSGTTLGQAIRTLPNIIDPTRATDAVQTTAASQPLLLTHTSGENYWWNATIGNFLSTPDALNNELTSNFSFVLDINIESFSGIQTLISKWDTNNVLGIDILTSRAVLINYRVGATTISVSTTTNFISLGRQTITITRNGTTGKWFVNGVDLGGVTGTLVASTSPLRIGTYISTGLQNILGKVYRLRYWKNDTQSGSASFDFNPNEYNPSTSQTQWTSSTGEVWSLNVGTATTGYKGALVTKTIVQSDGIDDVISASNLTTIALNTRLAAINLLNISGSYIIHGRSGGTGDRHLWHQTGGNIQTFSFAGTINFSNIQANRLSLLTTNFNTTSSNNLTNNANQANGTLASESYNRLDIFGNGTNGFKNCTLSTIIETVNVNTSTINTALYNYIRSINNSAF